MCKVKTVFLSWGVGGSPQDGNFWIRGCGKQDGVTTQRQGLQLKRRLETTERINDETALASEMTERISSWGTEATAQFGANSKFATKLMETKLQRTFHAGTK